MSFLGVQLTDQLTGVAAASGTVGVADMVGRCLWLLRLRQRLRQIRTIRIHLQVPRCLEGHGIQSIGGVTQSIFILIFLKEPSLYSGSLRTT